MGQLLFATSPTYTCISHEKTSLMYDIRGSSSHACAHYHYIFTVIISIKLLLIYIMGLAEVVFLDFRSAFSRCLAHQV